MKTILYICIVLSLFHTGLFAQKITMKEHYKYWYYRHRLLEEFVITGEATSLCTPSGLSIPALSAEMDSVNAVKLYLNWLDNPAAGLGYWIGVLATELKLLYVYNQPYANTQQELYYAMKAYERLDNNCECLFYPKLANESNGVINGLYMRDDVPFNFMAEDGGHTNFRDANNYATNISSIYQKYLLNDGDNGTNALKETYYPSGEEMKGLLTGFSMVVTALADCPAEVVIYNDYRFIEQAILHTQRNFDYCRANEWEGKLTNDSIYKYGDQLLPEMNGYGLAKAADFICDTSRHYAVPLRINPYRHYGEDFPDLSTLQKIELYFAAPYLLYKLFNNQISHDSLMTLQKWGWMMRGNPNSQIIEIVGIGQLINDYSLWGLGDFFGINLRGNVQYANSAMAFAAIGDSWKDWSVITPPNITYSSLVTYIKGAHWEYYPLLNLYLHNKVRYADTLRRNMVNYLIAAPCQGPVYLPVFQPHPDSGVAGWRSGFRWTDISPNGLDTNDSRNPSGRKYPGLDYMLAYNLLWLECLQKGILSTYFEPTTYVNGRDYDYTPFYGTQADTYFKYGDMNYAPLLGTSVKFNTKNVNFVGESIDISGNVEFSTGYTFNLVTYPKLNFCDLENYFGP